MDFGDLFKRGWQITWNNKFLYILGFLAALGGNGSSGGSGSGNINNIPTGNNTEDFEAFEDLFGEFGFDPSSFESMLPTIIGSIIAIVCILFVIRIVLWFIRLISEAGMIQSVADINAGGTSNFRQAFAQGREHIVPMFIANLILFIVPFVVVLIIIAISAFSFLGADGGIEDILPILVIPIICLVCLLIPYGIFTAFIYPIAQRGIVFKGLDGWSSLVFGWEFLKKNASDIVILGILFGVIGFIIGIIALVISLPILIGAGLPVFFALIEGSTPGAGAISLLVVGFLAMIVVGAFISAIFISFRSATFTLAFIELDDKDSAASAPVEKGPDDTPVAPLSS